MNDEQQAAGLRTAIEPHHANDRSMLQVEAALDGCGVALDRRCQLGLRHRAQVDHLKGNVASDRAVPLPPSAVVSREAQAQRVVMLDHASDRPSSTSHSSGGTSSRMAWFE